MTINRYKITKKGVAQAIKYLNSGKGHLSAPTWCEKFKNELKVKNGNVFFQDREVVPREDVDRYLEDHLGKQNVMSRDDAHLQLLTNTAGITRRMIMEFIKTRKETHSVPPATSLEKETTYQLVIKKRDLVACNPRFEKRYKQKECCVICMIKKSGICELKLGPAKAGATQNVVSELILPSGNVREILYKILKTRKALTIENGVKKTQNILNKNTA